MTVKDRQFGIRFAAVVVAVFAAYLGLARLLFETAIIGLGLIFFLFWFALSFFLLTRPPEIDPTVRRAPRRILPLRWRLLASGVAGVVISLLVMMWATHSH